MRAGLRDTAALAAVSASVLVPTLAAPATFQKAGHIGPRSRIGIVAALPPIGTRGQVRG